MFSRLMNSYFHFFQNFASLQEEDYQLFAQFLREKSFKKGDYLLRPGETQRFLYLVQNGVQMSYYESEKHLNVMAFTYTPSLCALPESFSLQKESEGFLQCLSDSSLLAIHYSDLQTVFTKSHAMESAFRKIGEHVLAGVIHRHAQLQALSMEERFRQFIERSPHLFQTVPHKYLASYLHIDPTNFSKLYNRIRL